MAKKFLTSLDLNKNQLLNAVIHSLSSAPSSPVAGQIYYNTGDNTLRYWNGTTWLTLAQGGSVEDAINAIVNELTTDDIEEGSTNLYFTDQRAIDAVGGSATSENTANTVVKRDSSGNFTAGTITANRVDFGDAGFIEDDGALFISATDTDITLQAADDIRMTAQDDIVLDSVGGDIRLDPNTGGVYVGSASAENRVATEGYVDTAATNAYNNAVSYADGLGTDDIGEGSTNLYFSEARARTAISSGNNTISYNSSTGEITANTATMATVNYVNGEISDLTTYVDQEISDSANTLTTAYEAADETLSDNLTAAYQSADNAIVSSLTQDFNDADNTVIETLRGEIAAASEGLDIKNSVKVATTGNINFSGVTTAIDGVNLAFPSTTRVLVKNQTNASENGIYDYLYSQAANTWTRSDDALELTAGTFVFVEQGTENGDHGYVISTDGPIVVGTTNIAWTQFSGAGRIIAGNGITKTGDTLSVTAHDGITVSSSGVSISNTYAGQTSIDTVGTITTGTWEGNVIDVAYGGTGADLSEEAVGSYVIVGDGGALTTSTTVTGASVSGDISGNAENVNGTVAIANGGTGATTAAGARSNLSATTKYAENNTTLNPVSNTITWTVSHDINTTDVTVQMRDLQDGALVEADVVVTNANTVTISWYSGATVSADAYRVVVVG
jgi:hypothetical protein